MNININMEIYFIQNNLQLVFFIFLKDFPKPSEPAPEHSVLTVVEHVSTVADVEAMLELTPPTESYMQVDTEVILVVFY